MDVAAQPRLLVVDDEEAICEGCRRILTRQGFAVEKTSDPVEGLDRATNTDYAAILLDIKMPAHDGIGFSFPVAQSPTGHPGDSDDGFSQRADRCFGDQSGCRGVRHEAVHSGRDHASRPSICHARSGACR